MRESDPSMRASLDDLDVLLIKADGSHHDVPFDEEILGDYDIVAMSVMTPQAPDAYLLNERIRKYDSRITSVIGGSHPRYYQEQVVNLPETIRFDFVVPQDGWQPMLQIATNQVKKSGETQVLCDSLPRLLDIPAPTRPRQLMERYNFEIGGAPAFHTITALGCPFTCYFCESGIEAVRTFSSEMIDKDLENLLLLNQLAISNALILSLANATFSFSWQEGCCQHRGTTATMPLKAGLEGRGH